MRRERSSRCARAKTERGWGRVGYAKSVSRGGMVFVEESAQAVSALDESCGRVHRRLDDLDAFAGEDGVEVAGEFAIAVADQEAKRSWSVLERPGELARLLGDPWPGRVGGAAREAFRLSRRAIRRA
jgi:hypothetical protein